MIVKLLTEHHLECLGLKRGYRGSSESTLVKMSNCWKPHAATQMRSQAAWENEDLYKQATSANLSLLFLERASRTGNKLNL